MIVFRIFKHLQKKRLLSPGSVSMTFDLCPSGSAPLFVCSFICGSFCEVLGLGPEWRPCSTSCGFWQRFCQTDNSVFVLVFGIPSATWSETLGWTGSDCYRDLKGTVQVLESVALTTRSLVINLSLWSLTGATVKVWSGCIDLWGRGWGEDVCCCLLLPAVQTLLTSESERQIYVDIYHICLYTGENCSRCFYFDLFVSNHLLNRHLLIRYQVKTGSNKHAVNWFTSHFVFTSLSKADRVHDGIFQASQATVHEFSGTVRPCTLPR